MSLRVRPCLPTRFLEHDTPTAPGVEIVVVVSEDSTFQVSWHLDGPATERLISELTAALAESRAKPVDEYWRNPLRRVDVTESAGGSSEPGGER